MSTNKKIFAVMGALIVIVIVVLAVILIPPKEATHFAFPSQQQAGNALSGIYSRSSLLERSNVNVSGTYVIEIEGHYYNSSSGGSLILAELETNNSNMAQSLAVSLNSTLSHLVYVIRSLRGANVSVSTSTVSYDGARIMVTYISSTLQASGLPDDFAVAYIGDFAVQCIAMHTAIPNSDFLGFVDLVVSQMR